MKFINCLHENLLRGGAAASGLVGQPKRFFEPRSGEKNVVGPPRGLGACSPQKSLKIKFLRLAKNAFPGIFLLVKQL